MAFISLYRKYRPEKFSDLVGQEHVVRTLRNALHYDRIAHAYLFAGPRGTGKTSTAKVFAMALNCREEIAEDSCGECQICQNIKAGKSLDVIEIDAASNRGIDEIRELREKVKFYPSEGDYKVYIIDEVHMLTKGAFNALLKTLEEPPQNVVFILATTEPHKVISTILSRCQRFDFSLLSVKDIQKRLAYICQKEEVETDSKSLNLIARSANGGLRDAISLLDQAISYTGGMLDVDSIQEMLGKVDIKTLTSFLQMIIDNRTSEAIQLLNQTVEQGKDVARFVNDLIEHCRELLIVRECGRDSGLLSYPAEILEDMYKTAISIDRFRLIKVIDILNDIAAEIKYNNNPRLILEIGIMKLSITGDESLVELSSRLEEIEDRMARISEISRAEPKVIRDSYIEKETTHKGQDHKPEETNNEDRQNSMDTEDIDKVRSENEQKQETGNFENKKDTTREIEETEPAEDSLDTENKDSDINRKSRQSDGSLNLDKIRKMWPRLLSIVKKEDIKANAFLIEGKPVKVEENIIYIEFPPDKEFHKKGAENSQELIGRVFNQILADFSGLVFTIEDTEGLEKPDSKKKIDSDGFNLNKLVEMFDGEVIEVDFNILEN